MVGNDHEPGLMAYRPTSLDFINHPNPVEPHTDPHKHPLHADQSNLRLLHDTNNVVPTTSTGEPPRKRRKSGDVPAPDMGRPTLPAVRQRGTEKRLRIPPTLSGLHQPPPDAGILPSISTDGLRSVELPERIATLPQKEQQSKASAIQEASAARSSHGLPSEQITTQIGSPEINGTEPSAKATKPRQNKKWTDSDTECLLKGVEKHGIGKWTMILKDPDLQFSERRNALDLKDRFRVCCPDHYKKKPPATPPEAINEDESGTARQAGTTSGAKKRRRRTTHRKTEADLRSIGIETSFAKSDRRRRTAYSEAEDDAILNGFRRHGKKWSQIRQDGSLGLGSRTATDLRDRMRNRWPDEYEKSGLKLGFSSTRKKSIRPNKTTDRAEHAENAANGETGSAYNREPDALVDYTTSTSQQSQRGVHDSSSKSALVKKTSAPFLSQADDVFWGLPLDADDERITLDRRILDWPADSNRQGATNNSEFVPGLHVPRRNAPVPAMNLPPTTQPAGSSTGALPSLATVTTRSMPFDFGEQLELPSLLEGFGVLDVDTADGRSGAQLMPSLDEILG